LLRECLHCVARARAKDDPLVVTESAEEVVQGKTPRLNQNCDELHHGRTKDADQRVQANLGVRDAAHRLEAQQGVC